MTAELADWLAQFPDCVLSALSADGAPLSVRCRPVPGGRAGTVHLNGPLGVALVPGPASLLCHRHDERLWQLRSFLARGALEPTGAGWVFTSKALLAGPGMAGPVGDARAFLAARRRAGRYLARRGIPRPRVIWNLLHRLP